MTNIAVLSVQEIMNAGRLTESCRQAVMRSSESIDTFVHSFRTRKPLQQQFLVVSLRQHNGNLWPIGVLVEEIAGGRLHGKLRRNDRQGEVLGRATVPLSSVVDWRYADCFELRGGHLFRAVLAGLRNNYVRRATIEDRSDFLIDAFHGESDAVQLFFDIGHGDLDKVGATLRNKPSLSVSTCTAPCITADGNLMRGMMSLAEWTVAHCDKGACELLDEFGAFRAFAWGKSEGLAGDSKEGDAAESLLLHAARYANASTIDWLVKKGFDTDVVGYGGDSPLIAAARRPWGADAVRCLLSHGAKVDAQDSLGRTALFDAATPAIAELLLKHGATLNATDDDGRGAVEYQRTKGREDLAEMLIKRGSKVSPGVNVEGSKEAGVKALRDYIRSTSGEDEAAKMLEALEVDYGHLLPCRVL
jgi:uncharacterized protein